MLYTVMCKQCFARLGILWNFLLVAAPFAKLASQFLLAVFILTSTSIDHFNFFAITTMTCRTVSREDRIVRRLPVAAQELYHCDNAMTHVRVSVLYAWR